MNEVITLPVRPASGARTAWLPQAWRAQDLAADDAGQQRAPHALLWTIVAFSAAAALWAHLAQVDVITRGDAKVITSSQTQLVQNLEGGIVRAILVKEGDRVSKDQALFQLDPLRFTAAFKEGRQGELGLRAKVARLSAEANGAPLQMPADVLTGAPELAANELAVHRVRAADLAGRGAVLREQLAQRTQEVLELQSRRDLSRQQLQMLQREVAITEPLLAQGAVSEVEVLRLQRELSQQQAGLEAATLAIPRLQSAIEEMRRKMLEAETQFCGQAAAELSVARNELAKAAEAVPGLEDRMARTLVRSPVNGVVKSISNKTSGGVVQSGTPMAEIVAVEDSLLVEARIRPQDIAFIAVGQKASVKLASYDASIYGSLDGTLVFVSADSMQASNPAGQSTEPYYTAHVRTLKPGIEHAGKLLPVMPGMTGQIDVLTDRRSVLHYLLKPINKTLERALSER